MEMRMQDWTAGAGRESQDNGCYSLGRALHAALRAASLLFTGERTPRTAMYAVTAIYSPGSVLPGPLDAIRSFETSGPHAARCVQCGC